MAKKAKKAAETKVEAEKPVQAESEPQKDGLIDVKSKTTFFDKELGKCHNVGDQWQVTDKRLKEIQAVEKAQNISLIEVL